MTPAPEPRRSPLGGLAAIGAVAIAVIAAILVLNVLRPSGEQPAARPSGSPSAQISPSVAPSASGVTPTPQASGATSAVKPDAQHGLVTFENIRTEDDARGLQQPPQFQRSAGAVPFTEGIGVSPSGKQVALVRTSQTTQQLITFSTNKPNDVTIVVDLSGSGELAGGVVWAGDGSATVLLAVHKQSIPGPNQAPTVYSTLRVVDVGTRQVREIARVTNGAYFMPLAWRPDRKIGAALEVAAGAANSYDLVREGTPAPERTPLGVMYGAITASRDGLRIAAVMAPAVRWWPMDQPSAAKELIADSRGRADFAAFRPGTDELGVSVGAPTVGGVPPPGHFEIWSLSGQQRVVSATAGFSRWRADGTAAIDGTSLVDPNTGAVTPLPGGAFKIVDVVLF
jgi:hypothetical protein